MRKVASLVGLAVVLAAAYGYDSWILPPMRRAAGQTFDPAPALWVQMFADVVIALAVLGLVWLLFRWSPPSRLVGLVYLLAGAALVAAWPLAAAFKLEIPGFAQLNLYLALGEAGSTLVLVGPSVVAIGLARLVLPLSMAWLTRSPRPAR